MGHRHLRCPCWSRQEQPVHEADPIGDEQPECDAQHARRDPEASPESAGAVRGAAKGNRDRSRHQHHAEDGAIRDGQERGAEIGAAFTSAPARA